jgi:hypothetical protein
MRRPPPTLMLLAAAGFSLMTAGHAAEPAASREDELKAAYLFNFAKFVEWPAGAEARPLTFCVVDARGISSALAAAVSDKHIGTRRLGVRSLSPAEPRDTCDLLYLASSAVGTSLDTPGKEGPAGHRPEAPVLTISDAEGFARHGGMIEMFSEGNRIRFNINAENARRAGLRISSNLLRLATKVE